MRNHFPTGKLAIDMIIEPALSLKLRRCTLYYAAGETIFTFIPKVGCTNLKLSLLSSGPITPEAEWLSSPHQAVESFIATNEDIRSARFSFVMLRDPYTRIVSCYFNKIVAKTTPKITIKDDFKTYMSMVETFRGFVAWLAIAENVQKNPHWRPQSDFLSIPRYSKYYALENYSEAAVEVEQRCGLKLKDFRTKTKHTLVNFTRLKSGCFADTPLSELRAMKEQRAMPEYLAMYDANLVEMVRNLYAADIELYRSNIEKEVTFA